MTQTRAQAHPYLILAICCISLLLVGMDVTIVNVALPAIQRDLHASLAQLQWILDAYTLVVASLLMFSGAMSDRFGRRRVFQIGLVLFLLGSLVCSLAPSIEWLILFRAVQGLGASMLNPVALSIIANTFKNPAERARAVGIWGAVSGVSLAVGPLVGGALTETVGWRAIFWINIPIGLAAIALSARYVPESKSPTPRAFDPVGQLLIFLALATITSGIIEGPHAGWFAPKILVLFAASILSLGAFLAYEARHKHPMLDLRFFQSIPFASATGLAVCAFSSFAAFLFLNALYLEQARHLSAFTTGLCTLPLAIASTITAPLSGRLVAARGPRLSLLIAGLGFTLGTLLLTTLATTTSILLLLTAYTFFGIGMGMVNPAITNSAVAGMPLSQAGVAAAIASTCRQVGAALGVAISGTVLSTAHQRGGDFSAATHALWWLMTALGGAILVIGWMATSAWARSTSGRVAHLLEDSRS